MNQMSPTNALSAQILKIANDLQSGTLPSTTQNVMHLMGLKSQLEKANAMGRAQQMAQQPQPTVKDQVLASAIEEAKHAQAPQGIAQGTASNGIDHLQTNLPTQGMAQGGIIAFDEGGEVQHFANQGQVRFTGANQADTEGYIVDGNYPGSPYDQSIFGYGPRAMGALVSDVLGLPGKLAWSPYDEKTGLQHRYEKEGFFPNVSGFEQNEINRIKSGNAKTAQIVADAKANAAKKAMVQEAKINGVANPAIRPASADAAGISSLASNFAGAGTDNPLLTALGDRGVPDKTKDGAPPPSASEDPNVLRLLKGSRGAGSGNGPVSWSTIDDTSGEFTKLQETPKTIEEFMNEKRARMGENKGLTEREARLKKMEEETNTMEEKSPWLALMRAGIGAMKGTSQHALANIGAGAEEGLNDYIKTQDKVTARKDKLFDAQTNLADAKRNEELAIMKYGEDSKQAQDAKNQTLALHAIADKHATQLENSKGTFQAQDTNAKIASDRENHQMAAGVQLAINKADIDSRNYIADLTNSRDISKEQAAMYHQISQDTHAMLKTAIGDKGIDSTGMGPIKSLAEYNAMYYKALATNQKAAGLPVRLPPEASTGTQSSATLPALTDKTAASFFR
jgi:hypothetical protein